MTLLIAAMLAASTPVPVLVELFTSEGCSSCPPADAVLARLIKAQPVPGATVVGLSEHVDYWNSLGWKDPFSDALFTGRQEDYSSVIARGRVYTPQMVVGGSVDVLGSDERAARSAVAEAAKGPHGTLRLERRGKGIHVAGQDFPPHGDAHVIFAVVEDGLSNQVLRGENQGRTLSHDAVVRSLERIGLASGASFDLDVRPTLDASWKAPRFVAFVQELKSRKVLAAAELGP